VAEYIGFQRRRAQGELNFTAANRVLSFEVFPIHQKLHTKNSIAKHRKNTLKNSKIIILALHQELLRYYKISCTYIQPLLAVPVLRGKTITEKHKKNTKKTQ
jgi:hypothetical protein